jgi:hypothetical protein
VNKINELGTTLAALFTLMMEGTRSCEKSVRTGRQIAEDSILHSHRRETTNLIGNYVMLSVFYVISSYGLQMALVQVRNSMKLSVPVEHIRI